MVTRCLALASMCHSCYRVFTANGRFAPALVEGSQFDGWSRWYCFWFVAVKHFRSFNCSATVRFGNSALAEGDYMASIAVARSERMIFRKNTTLE